MAIERRDEALRLLAALAEAHGAPGAEGAVRRIFREELRDGLRVYPSGNIVCERPGTSERPRIMLTAHMDEVGFVVHSFTRSGLIKFLPLGGWWAHTVLAQRVRVRTQQGQEHIGVIGAKPPHFLTEGEREKLMRIEDMFIDIGAESAEEIQERFGVAIGDSIVPESRFTPMANPDYLLCKAFDNRVGMALVIQSVRNLAGLARANTVFAVGTVQEELGMRGGETAARAVAPDAAIVLEGTPADDLPGFADEERQAILGRGVQIRLMDASAVLNRPFIQHVVAVAKANGIPFQLAVRKSGGTDAKPIHLHGSGVPTVVLGVPARYIHTHNAIIHLKDYLGTLEFVLRLLESLDEATVERFGVTPD